VLQRTPLKRRAVFICFGCWRNRWEQEVEHDEDYVQNFLQKTAETCGAGFTSGVQWRKNWREIM